METRRVAKIGLETSRIGQGGVTFGREIDERLQEALVARCEVRLSRTQGIAPVTYTVERLRALADPLASEIAAEMDTWDQQV